jgi:nucleoside-diphosphate-sugar epimerase
VGELRCDRNDVDAVRSALKDSRFDAVYDNVYDWQRGTTAEQVSAAAVAAASAGTLRRYVFTSSVAAYAGTGEGDESGPLAAADHPNAYAAQKAESERVLFALHRDRGIPVSTLRPTFIYGPHNPFDREAFFWDRMLADRPIVVPEDGARLMQWIHVQDVARAAVRAGDEPGASGRAYNLANYPPITQIEYVQLLATVAGRHAQLVRIPRQQIERLGGQLFAPPFYFGVYLDVPLTVARNDRVRSELGVDLTPFEDGLRETYRWYQEQPRPQPDFSWEDRLLTA